MTYQIQFESRPKQPMAGFTDTAIKAAREWSEKCRGKLAVDPKTDFPSFTVWDESGNEIGGG